MEYFLNVIRGMAFVFWLTLRPVMPPDQVIVHQTIEPVTYTKTEVPATITPTNPPPEPAKPKSSEPLYVLENHPSGQEGFYVIKNAPAEPMSTKDELIEAVQTYRQAHGLNQISVDDGLCRIAEQRAVEASVEFSHDQFSKDASEGKYNFVEFTTISENLWDGSFSGVHIVEFGWDRSPGHRANLQGGWSRGCAGIHGTTAVFVFAN